MALVGGGVQPIGQAVAARGRKRMAAESTRAGVTTGSWHARRPSGNARTDLHVRAWRLACSTLFVHVVVGIVTAVLSSPNRSIGWAQAGTGFVGFAVFAGFAACIALLASAGVVGGSKRGAREDARAVSAHTDGQCVSLLTVSLDDGRKNVERLKNNDFPQ